MKKGTLICATALSAIFMSFKTTDAATWSVDKMHSKLGFTITHLMVSDVEGSFKSFDATITGTKDDFSDATVNMSADVNSVNTENEKRDEHLKSADFFDAAKYPTITYKSTSFKKAGKDKYVINGALTMHGVTKPVQLTATARTGVNPMSKKAVTGFKIIGKIKRTDFNLSSSTPTSMLSDEVEIVANTEFSKS